MWRWFPVILMAACSSNTHPQLDATLTDGDAANGHADAAVGVDAHAGQPDARLGTPDASSSGSPDAASSGNPDAHVAGSPDASVSVDAPTILPPDAHVGAPDARPTPDATSEPDATPPPPGTWTRLDSGTTVDLFSIWGTPDGDNIWVGGINVILYSNDHGQTWTSVYTPQSLAYFWNMWGSSATDVYAVTGSGVHHWDGVSWAPQTIDISQGGGLFGIWGRSASDVFGFAIEDNLDLQHTTGDGMWMNVGSADTETDTLGPHCTGIGFGDQILYFAYESLVGRSGDNGQNWSATQLTGDDDDSEFASIWGTSQFDIYVSGEQGYIAYSNDDGVSWNPQVVPTTNNIDAIWGTGPTDVYAVGVGATILHTVDHGTTWAVEKNGTSTEELHAVWGPTASEIYTVGTGGLILRRTE